jgi:hypothetical protein
MSMNVVSLNFESFVANYLFQFCSTKLNKDIWDIVMPFVFELSHILDYVNLFSALNCVDASLVCKSSNQVLVLSNQPSSSKTPITWGTRSAKAKNIKKQLWAHGTQTGWKTKCYNMLGYNCIQCFPTETLDL